MASKYYEPDLLTVYPAVLQFELKSGRLKYKSLSKFLLPA
jgi:hypothetical protein